MSQDPSHHCIDLLTTSIPLNKSINLQSAAINNTKHWPTIVIGLLVTKKVVSKSAKNNCCLSIPLFPCWFLLRLCEVPESDCFDVEYV